MDDHQWELANNWAIHKLMEAGYTDGDNPDVQLAQRGLVQAALVCPALIDHHDDGTTELARPHLRVLEGGTTDA